jgi:Putative transposase
VVVPGGGLSPDGNRWVSCRAGYFLPVRVLSRLFRRLFIEALEKAFRAGELAFFSALADLNEPVAFQRYFAPVRQAEWVVYAKRPFAGPEQVLEYVGRYTHRVAISNNRLLDIEDGQVRFQWKDYRRDAEQKTMTLSADEFIRRFLTHVLPSGFQRIRYYGLLGNRYRRDKLARCRELIGMPKLEPKAAAADKDYRETYETLTGVSLCRCPVCPAAIWCCSALFSRSPRAGSNHHRYVMTTQQPSRFHTAPNGLFEGNQTTVAVRLESSLVPSYSRLDGATSPRQPTRWIALAPLFGARQADQSPTRLSPRAGRRHLIPIAPPPCGGVVQPSFKLTVAVTVRRSTGEIVRRDANLKRSSLSCDSLLCSQPGHSVGVERYPRRRGRLRRNRLALQ